jgi:hypothetical protein
MAEEHWSVFFKAKAPKESEVETEPEITIATTTDSRQQLNEAGEGVQREPEPQTIYTEIAPSTPEADGGTEHNEAKVWVDGVRVCRSFGDDVPPPPGENAEYMTGVNAARQVLPDFDEVLADSVPIPAIAVEAIRACANGPLVAYYFGKHRSEIDGLWGLSDGQVRRRIVDLSQRIALNPVGADPGTLPYRAWRTLRDGHRKR